MKFDHPIVKALKKELTNWNIWQTRIVVVTMAAIAGLVVVGFTWLSEKAVGIFFQLNAGYRWLPLIWTPVCAMIIVWLTRRYAAGAAGSGIPQVMAALDPSVHRANRPLFVSLKLSLSKDVADDVVGGTSRNFRTIARHWCCIGQ